MNLPGVIVDLPTLTAKDEVDLVEWGVPNDIDFIAASFVRKGSDLDYIRKVGLRLRVRVGVRGRARVSVRKVLLETIQVQGTCWRAAHPATAMLLRCSCLVLILST